MVNLHEAIICEINIPERTFSREYGVSTDGVIVYWDAEDYCSDPNKKNFYNLLQYLYKMQNKKGFKFGHISLIYKGNKFSSVILDNSLADRKINIADGLKLGEKFLIKGSEHLVFQEFLDFICRIELDLKDNVEDALKGDSVKVIVEGCSYYKVGDNLIKEELIIEAGKKYFLTKLVCE